jgi:hypothetical protein
LISLYTTCLKTSLAPIRGTVGSYLSKIFSAENRVTKKYFLQGKSWKNQNFPGKFVRKIGTKNGCNQGVLDQIERCSFYQKFSFEISNPYLFDMHEPEGQGHQTDFLI